MIYTLFTAFGDRYIVDMSKSGNKYTTGFWDKREHVSKTFYHDTYDEAEAHFHQLMVDYNAPYITEPKFDGFDWSDFD